MSDKLVKHLNFGQDAKDQIFKGIEKLTKAVSSTLGASGKCVILEDDQGKPIITKDGVTVANSVVLFDAVENMGATLLKEAARKTVEEAGDGTTTATVLAEAILKEAVKKDINTRELKEGINSAVKKVVNYLEKVSIPVEGKMIDQVATISANNDPELGKLIGGAFKDVDKQGNEIGWIVVDLKTGRPPKGNLSETVNRQLRFYRDLLILINPNHPPIRTEGWYTSNQTMHEATGPSVTEDAFRAWESIELTENPFEATPQEFSCGFCEWKAWCPKWFLAIHDDTLKRHKTFNDEVVTLINFDAEEGLASFKIMLPDGINGQLRASEKSFGAFLSNQPLNQLRELQDKGYEGPLFLGSTRIDGRIRHLGDWSEILPWNPLLKSIRK